MNVLSNTISGLVIMGTAVVSLGWASASVGEQPSDIECLAMNIYHEARGEPIVGQIAVAQVTMNRVEHEYFPDDVCSVVWQDDQFSWTNNGKPKPIHNRDSYRVALSIAQTVYHKEEDDPTEGALFYHADYISAPLWTRNMEISTIIGTHIFYSWDGRWN
jgi:N-acetylmuramoyl-L-alanine amidase